MLNARGPVCKAAAQLPSRRPLAADRATVSPPGENWKIAQNAGQSIITQDLPGGIGAVWTARDSARLWLSIASSSDGTKLGAVVYGGQIYTSIPRTTAGTAGSISGAQYDAIELQYIGNNTFMVLSHEGYLTVQ